ncbi:flagellin [Kistimonas asteriae]|uniref:flagellin N-terminal helical domain-containing protein n=1 Tax=Kistimonas asteriae TaxID=517724 RepID=UPI001BA7F110|nr:flagellin [Kistimonas asteriae]
MSLSIITNSPSLTAQQSLERAQNGLEASMKKLSTGYQINSAKDDAAGLQISNRMTSQVNGLSVAIRNANDGISVSQTAEGAMAETTSILHRIRDLSLQSANASNDAQDRVALQREVSQLQSEIDRIAETTTFNSLKVLDGSYTNKNFQVGANAYETISVSIGNMRASTIGGIDKTLDVVRSGSEFGTVSVGGDGTLTNPGSMTITGSRGAATIAIDGADSAKSIATKVNQQSMDTGVTARARTDVALSGFSLAGGSTFSATINGVELSGLSDLAGLATAVNGNKNLQAAGITASSTGDKLTAAQGDTIALSDLKGANLTFGTQAMTAQAPSAYAMGQFGLTSSEGDITVSGTAATTANVAQTTGRGGSVTIDSGSKFGTVDVGATPPTAGAAGGAIKLTGPLNAGGAAADVTIAANDSAADVATKINAKTADTGVKATAKNEVVISQLASLSGIETLTIKVDIEGGSASEMTGIKTLADLATKINGLGISTLSAVHDSTKDTVILTESAGNTIEISDFASTGSPTLSVGGKTMDKTTNKAASIVGTFELTADGSISIGGTPGAGDFASTSASAGIQSGSDFSKVNAGMPSPTRILSHAGSMVVKGPVGSGTILVDGTDTAQNIANKFNAVSGETGVVAKANTEALITDINIGTGLNGMTPSEVSVVINGEQFSIPGPKQFADSINANPRLQQQGVSAKYNTDGSVLINSDVGGNIEISQFRANVSNDESVKVNGKVLDAAHNSALVTGTFELQADGDINLKGPAVEGVTTNLSDGKSTVESRTMYVTDIDITTEAGAQQAVSIIDDAIADIDSQRGTLGAIQNRLEHTIFNLQSIRENVTNSRSRIKDTDYASEMAEMTKQQILKQASIANLAQANEMARDVLMLIR